MAAAKATKLEVTQVKSKIGAKDYQRATLRSLGLRRINHTVIRDDNPSTRGMIATVAHLVKVEEVK